MKINDEEFKNLRELIFKHFGINLTDAKRALVVGRLQSILRKYNFSTFGEYYQHVLKDQHGQAINELVNKITTNFTYFYREEDHFDYFIQTVLPWIIKSNEEHQSKDIRLWCAGCASGEEPYTIIMFMMEFLKHNYHQHDAGILATDISEKALSFAKAAVYPEERLQRLPKNIRSKYFKKQANEEFIIDQKIINEVVYRRLNLMNEKFPFKKKFHSIFCRNVMIYFNQETRNILIQKFVDLLEDDGYLFIGHSESLGKENFGLSYVKPAVYRKGNP